MILRSTTNEFQDPISFPKSRILIARSRLTKGISDGNQNITGNIMNSCKKKTCCRRFSCFSQIQEEKAQLFIKNWPGESGVAGAMNGLVIPFAEVRIQFQDF